METDELFPLLAANLASLNEITTELAQALADKGMADQEWADVAWRSLREHSWSLGFEFQGVPEPAIRVAAPCEDVAIGRRTEIVSDTGGRL